MCVLAMAGSTQGAWAADTEIKTVLSQDFEACDGTIPFSNYAFNGKGGYTAAWSLKTSGSNTLLQAYSNVNGGRTGYVDFGVNSSSVTDNWTLSFDCAITPCTGGQQQMVVTAANNAVTANNMITSAAYLILTNESASSTSYSVTIGDVTLDNKITLASGNTYNYTLALTGANTSTASLNVIIKNGESEVLNATQTVDPLTMGFLRGFFDYNGKNAGTETFDNILLTKEVEAGVCEQPICEVTGANGTARKFTLSCTTDGAKIYYSATNLTAGAAGWTEYTGEAETTATTIYAYAATSSATSEVISFATGAGTEIALNKATFSLLYFDVANNGYSIKVSDNQSDLLGAPSSVLKYYTTDEANAIEVKAGEFITGIESGATLYVVASAKGYTSSTASYVMPSSREADTYASIWSDDFTSGGTLTNSGSFSLSKINYEIITQIGGTDISGNVGLYAYNTTRWSSTTNGLVDNGTYYWAVQNVSALGYVKVVVTAASFENSLLSGRANISGSYTVKNEDGTYSIYYKPSGNMCSWNGKTGLTIKSISFLMPTVSISLPYTYTTFSSTAALDFTDNADVEAYMAQMNGDGTAVTLKQVQKVPAGTGVVLKKKSGAETTTVKVLADAAALAGNQLVGVTEDNTVSADQLIEAGNAYVLVKEQFCKVVTGATGYIPAGKAYLSVPVRNAAKALRLDFNGTPTEVVSVAEKAEKAQDAIYNVQGIRVQKPTVPGLYIVNGKTYKF